MPSFTTFQVSQRKKKLLRTMLLNRYENPHGTHIYSGDSIILFTIPHNFTHVPKKEEDDINTTQSHRHSGILKECRDVNPEFSEKVFDYLQM